MKYLICSDIHGSYAAMKKVIERFNEKKMDQLIMLGDVLYHGPRNPLPEDHNPAAVAELLNQYKDKIIAVRGNCDAEVDQMVLEFPCLSEYTLVVDEGIRLFLAHGHSHTPETFPVIQVNDVYLYGHTHLWEIEKRQGIWYCNPGSIALPKEGRPATYATYENGTISILDFEDNILKEVKLK